MWLIAMAGCATELSTSEVEQHAGDYQAGDYQSGDYQAGDYQAGDYQAGDYQAGDYQGAHYSSSSFSGATLNGSALTDISITGTTLMVWKKIKASVSPYYGWEQRTPNRICTWNADRSHATCTIVDPSTTASPLAGARFKTTLRTATGTMTGWVQIGASSSALNAVKPDSSYAMWMLTNIHNNGPYSYSANAPVNCTNAAGCRQNNDLWTYDLRLINADGSQVPFCSSGQSYALKGTWDSLGEHAASSTDFSFACSTGTIAKCTRWGYRPWITSYTKSDGSTVSFDNFHQACVRAAMADYCTNGHSFTKFHTLVDIYDYAGFIPSMQALYPTTTAFI
ncbi:MAG TPA: ADYC domain-containing protein, partial [Kofleriaceae bacterium]|nr:ADYC domain-containing protein [Kofleriaceae bacterium]